MRQLMISTNEVCLLSWRLFAGCFAAASQTPLVAGCFALLNVLLI